MKKLRKLISFFRRTPLHPQWLMGPRSIPQGIEQVGGVVLDIGAADRWIQKHLGPNASYLALDYPATGADMYNARPDVFADGARLPFKEACFDAVVCLEVLEHVAEPTQVMQEISRVLKSDGLGFISMPFLYPLHDAPYDFQRYTEYGLRRDAEKAGLEVINIQSTGHAVRTAGLLLSLALAGGAAAGSSPKNIFWLILAAPLIFFINIFAWFTSLLWPDWSHIQHGHTLEVRKNG